MTRPRTNRAAVLYGAWLCLIITALLISVQCAAADEWNIEDTGQPFTDVQFTVTEGTWMSVAVSPDGKTLVFDLLGDIFSLPAAGGQATLLHGGPAMQRMPSFSRDGRKLLYLSDASGADNIWVSNADGSQARQVTHETHDMLTGPAWSPDGESVVAAKSYAAFSWMRSSEIRLFDLAGGAGRVIVDMPANHRDVEEAKLSPEGRYLYYTERISSPNIFQDANHENFVIERLDLHAGATEVVLGGFGSATTPEISPDGTLIAFVRRVKTKTVLFVYDTRSREERPVYDALDRDIQADFVPHGTYYPQFGWFPDNRHIAIWGKGKLVNVDTLLAQAREIPFRAQLRERITRAPRFEHNLAPERFTVRALGQIVVRADGRQAVFAALGHLWRKSLPRGLPARLTSDRAFEYEPTLSADNHRVAYVAWDDEHGSALNVVALDGSKPQTVLRTPGIVRQPAFSPDGRRLAFWISRPDKRLGGYRAKPGLYWLSLQDHQVHRLLDEGAAPRFAPDGQRVYFTDVLSNIDNPHFPTGAVLTRLESVDLNGLERREHARSAGTDIVDLTISPDLHWLAFRDRQQYYLAPYQETGRPMTVSAATDAVLTTKLTDAGGYGLSWSTDSRTVHWVLGPSLYKFAVADLLHPNAPPESYAQADLEAPTDVPRGTIAFVNGRLITLKGEEVIEKGTVVVTGNHITAVGPAERIAVPPGARVFDVSGKTLMPGLIDMHGHIDCCHSGAPLPQKQPMRYAALAFGVTTNFDPYSSDLPNYTVNEMNLAGLTIGPRAIGSGAVIYGRPGTPGPSYVPIDSLTDARHVMANKNHLGGLFIKSYRQEIRSQRQQLVKAGREAGVMVDVEGESHLYNNITEILDGHTNLEHSLPVATYYDDLVQLFAHSATSNTPTLVVVFGELFGENYLYQTTRAWEDPKVRAYVQETTSDYSPLEVPSDAPPYVRGMTSIHVADELWDVGFRSVARSVKKLDDAGVIINAGSHGQVAGLALHWEMWLLAQGGMSNYHVLRTATLNGARTLALDRQLGSLEPGKLADLIVLDRNPLEDIHNTNSVRYTMVNGRLYESLSLREVGHYDRPRGRFFWERTDQHGIDWSEAWSQQ